MMKRQAHFVFLEQTASTNDYLQELLMGNDYQQFTVVYAHHQTSGKGQGSNFWVSEPGENLTFSLLFKTKTMQSGSLFVINKSIAISLVQYLYQYHQIEAAIKWPNDIIVNMKKIAGILIENIFSGNHIYCIIGIGLNINQTEFHAMNPPAVSLKNLLGNNFDLNQCLEQLTDIIICNLIKTNTSEKEVIVREYDEQLLYRNTERNYLYHNKNVKGIIEGVNNSGQLVFKNSLTGKTDFIDHGNFVYNL